MASIEGSVSEPLTPGGDDEDSQVWLRIRRTEQVLKLRVSVDEKGNKVRPKSWRQIGKILGISYETARKYHADGLKWGERQDVLGLVDTEIAFREQILIELSKTYATCRLSNPSAAVGALKAMLDVSHERVQLLQAAGRVPRNLARWRQEAEWTTIVRELMGILERSGADREVLLQLQTLVRRHAPDHADNVRDIGTAPSVVGE